MMRVFAAALRPLQPTFARLIQADVVMDTWDMSFDASETIGKFPTTAPLRLAEVLRRKYLDPAPRETAPVA